MKKFASLMLGLSLVVGSASLLFGQEEKKDEKKTAKKKAGKKKTKEGEKKSEEKKP